MQGCMPRPRLVAFALRGSGLATGMHLRRDNEAHGTVNDDDARAGHADGQFLSRCVSPLPTTAAPCDDLGLADFSQPQQRILLKYRPRPDSARTCAPRSQVSHLERCSGKAGGASLYGCANIHGLPLTIAPVTQPPSIAPPSASPASLAPYAMRCSKARATSTIPRSGTPTRIEPGYTHWIYTAQPSWQPAPRATAQPRNDRRRARRSLSTTGETGVHRRCQLLQATPSSHRQITHCAYIPRGTTIRSHGDTYPWRGGARSAGEESHKLPHRVGQRTADRRR